LLKKKLSRMIQSAVGKAIASGSLKIDKLPSLTIEVPKNREHGDLCSSVSFNLAKQTGRQPEEIAGVILDCLETGDGGSVKFIKKKEIAGRGFLNFFIDESYLRQNLLEIVSEGGGYGSSDSGKGKKIQVEFASVGPTGPIHIGHARGAVVGDALGNILKKSGYETVKEYYVNDVGTQIDILGKSLKARYCELCGLAPAIVENGYEGEYLKDIAGRLKEKHGSGCLEKPPDFFSGFAVEQILECIKKDLSDFGVVFDSWVTESSLYSTGKVAKAIDTLKEKGFTSLKDGALWFNLRQDKGAEEGQEDRENVLVRSTGTPTYFASDIAYHSDKYNRNFDAIIDIWGQDHHGHVQRVRNAVSALGYDPSKLEIILYQLVSLSRKGSPVRMSTRRGEFITLREVMEEVGSETIRFFFLMRKSSSHLNFDLELAKEQSMESPVYYVQYAHARICSIFNEASNKELQIAKCPKGIHSDKLQNANLELLKDDIEIQIMKRLAFFPDEIAEMAVSREPHGLTVYAQEIAGLFHRFYTDHRVISDDRDLTLARLTLVKAIQTVLAGSFGLMGISPKEKM